MIGSNIQKYSHIGAKIIHVIKLKTAQLYNIILMRRFGNLKGEALTDIPRKPDVQSRLFKDMIRQRGSRSLAIGAGDTYHLRVARIPACKLNLRYYRYFTSDNFLYYRSFIRNARTFNYLVGRKNLFYCMPILFKCNTPLNKRLTVRRFDSARIRNKDIISLFRSQHSRSNPALPASKYNNSIHKSTTTSNQPQTSSNFQRNNSQQS